LILPPIRTAPQIAYLLVFGLHIARGILAASAFDVETNVSQYFIDFLPQQDTNKLREQVDLGVYCPICTTLSIFLWFCVCECFALKICVKKI
jgi:hypothetical protein